MLRYRAGRTSRAAQVGGVHRFFIFLQHFHFRVGRSLSGPLTESPDDWSFVSHFWESTKEQWFSMPTCVRSPETAKYAGRKITEMKSSILLVSVMA